MKSSNNIILKLAVHLVKPPFVSSGWPSGGDSSSSGSTLYLGCFPWNLFPACSRDQPGFGQSSCAGFVFPSLFLYLQFAFAFWGVTVFRTNSLPCKFIISKSMGCPWFKLESIKLGRSPKAILLFQAFLPLLDQPVLSCFSLLSTVLSFYIFSRDYSCISLRIGLKELKQYSPTVCSLFEDY